MTLSAPSPLHATDSLYDTPSLDSPTSAAGVSAQSGTTAAGASSTSTGFESTSSQSSSLFANDTVQLLKDLSTGDVAAAKSDLAQLQKDIKSQDGAASTTGSQESSLSKLLTKLSQSLDSGNTSTALTALAAFLVQHGKQSGILVDITA